ncbi:MAG: hypothetical protein E4G98_00690 [Promethearchaeota archaeon]|nr:MAG: hypothetical protein E4G98_00690 [Candidatus Lokiarchaeota archaeon]
MKIEKLSEIENQTYQVIKDILKNHKQFTLNDLLTQCFATLCPPHTEETVAAALDALAKKRYFIKGTTLTREDVANNAVRARILNFIMKNPGAYNRLIRRECNLGSNEFKWHLGMLLKFHFIKKVPFNGRSYGYFEDRNYMNHEFDLFLLQNEKVKMILEYLAVTPNSISGIARDLGIHYSTVQKYMEILMEREFVQPMMENDHHEIYHVIQTLMIKLRKIVNGQAFIEFATESRSEV